MTRTRTPGLVALALCCASRVAVGSPAISTSGELPFSRDELESALAARAGHSALAVRVQGDAETVEIEVEGRATTVALDGARGADAARIVAFTILDAAGEQLEPPAIPHEPVATRFPAWSIGLWAMGGTRQVAAIDLGVRVRGRVGVVGSGGVALAETSRAMDRAVELRSFPLRLGAAIRLGPIELRGGGTAVVYHARADRASTDVVLGGGVAAAYVVPVRGFALLAGGGADVFMQDLAYRVDGIPVTTTEHKAWWLGVALAREAR